MRDEGDWITLPGALLLRFGTTAAARSYASTGTSKTAGATRRPAGAANPSRPVTSRRQAPGRVQGQGPGGRLWSVVTPGTGPAARQVRNFPRKPWLGSDPSCLRWPCWGQTRRGSRGRGLDLAGHALGTRRCVPPPRDASQPDRVFAACVRAQVEPPVAGDDLEPRLLEECPPVADGEPGRLHRGLRLAAAHVERQSRAPDPNAPAPRCPARAPASVVRLLDVLGARREDVEDEAAAGLEQATSTTPARGAARPSSAGGGRVRNGEVTRRTRSATGGSRRSPEVAGARRRPPPLVAGRRPASRRRSTPMTVTPARATATAMRPSRPRARRRCSALCVPRRRRSRRPR